MSFSLVLVASEGLNPGAPGARVAIAKGKRYLVDGPFAESKELVGGFYIIEVASLEEAIQWALRAPTGLGTDDILEIRQLTGADAYRFYLLSLEPRPLQERSVFPTEYKAQLQIRRSAPPGATR